MYDPNVTPDWNFFPWMNVLRQAVGGTQATVLLIMVAILCISGIAFAAGQYWDHGRTTQIGKVGIVFSLIGAFITGASSDLVNWSALLGIF